MTPPATLHVSPFTRVRWRAIWVAPCGTVTARREKDGVEGQFSAALWLFFEEVHQEGVTVCKSAS